MDNIIQPKTLAKIGEMLRITFLFVGRAILVLFGLLGVVFFFWDAFEQSISFLEISTMEMMFFVVFFILIKNHIEKSSMYKMPWKTALYLPLRNIGWFSLLSIIPIIFLIMQSERGNNIISEYEHILQLIKFIVIAFCIYMATPKDVNA